jgi:splicing factor 3B subunit 1
MATPTTGFVPMTPEQSAIYKWEREIESRNQQISDEELDALFPPGYRVLQPPAGYNPIRTPSRKLLATPTPMDGSGGFMIPQTPERGGAGEKIGAGGIMDTQPKDKELPALKPEDIQYFEVSSYLSI